MSYSIGVYRLDSEDKVFKQLPEDLAPSVNWVGGSVVRVFNRLGLPYDSDGYISASLDSEEVITKALTALSKISSYDEDLDKIVSLLRIGLSCRFYNHSLGGCKVLV